MASAVRDGAAAGSAGAGADAQAGAPQDASGASSTGADDSAWVEEPDAVALGDDAYDEEYDEEEEDDEEDIRPRALPVDGEPDFDLVRSRTCACVCACLALAQRCATAPYVRAAAAHVVCLRAALIRRVRVCVCVTRRPLRSAGSASGWFGVLAARALGGGALPRGGARGHRPAQVRQARRNAPYAQLPLSLLLTSCGA
jgi:hypothetical protein